MAQQLTTNLVRVSYVNVFKPRENQQGVEKYSVTCLLPKTDTEGYNALMMAIEDEKNLESNGKLKGVAQVKHPIHDGDGVTQNGTEFGPECKGHWVFTASCNAERPPAVVDQRVQPVLDQTQVYSGMYAHVGISVYAYNNNSRGIGFGLNGIQKVRDGEPLGFSFNPKSAFAPVQSSAANQIKPVQIDPLTGLPL